MARTTADAELVLFVDDEKAVVRIGRTALERAGFRVATASDGLEALDVLERLGDEVRVLVLDVSLPGLEGDALLERVRRLRPHLPVVISSGFDDPPVDPGPAGSRASALLPKPYLPSELVACVRALLESDARLRAREKEGGADGKRPARRNPGRRPTT